jgi:Fe-S-cluster-containing dehydrogenase component
MGKRLYIDLNRCDQCEACAVGCAYFYRPRATDHGILKLRELAALAVVCRRCEEPSCAAACRYEALERQPDGVMKRANLRCVSCKCCVQACPFGTLYPDMVPFFETNCDYCVRLGPAEPPCVASCVKQALAFREVEESPDQSTYLVGERLAVKAPKWDRKAV